jgi:hypothetical protein
MQTRETATWCGLRPSDFWTQLLPDFAANQPLNIPPASSTPICLLWKHLQTLASTSSQLQAFRLQGSFDPIYEALFKKDTFPLTKLLDACSDPSDSFNPIISDRFTRQCSAPEPSHSFTTLVFSLRPPRRCSSSDSLPKLSVVFISPTCKLVNLVSLVPKLLAHLGTNDPT